VIDVDARFLRRCGWRSCVRFVGIPVLVLRQPDLANAKKSKRQHRKSHQISHATILLFALKPVQMRRLSRPALHFL
jgi:hypothetical protein